MRKVLFWIFFIVLLVGCISEKKHPIEEDLPVSIKEACEGIAEQELTPEEIAHWDSMNAEGGYMLIRNAERNLDTTVNHLHMIFITEP